MKHTLTLDDEPVIDFDDISFLSILADLPAYALVDDLNHLYDLSFCRTDDAVVGSDTLPLYVYADPMRHLSYYLVELPVPSEGYLLIVKGASCRDTVEAIENEFNSVADEPHPADLPAVQRYRILQRYHESFTPVSIVTFTGGELDIASHPGRRQLKGRPGLADLFARILDFIDLHRLDG